MLSYEFEKIPLFKTQDSQLRTWYNAPAAQHTVAVIEHNRLPGRNRPLGLLEHNPDALIMERRHDRRVRLEVRARLRHALEWSGGPLLVNKGDAARHEFAGRQCLLGADDHGVARRVERGDVQRLPDGDAETFALANSVERQAIMLA
jgi:hypothetical protein